jgi:hypothetical protein
MCNIASQETGDRRRKPKECRAILWRSASAFRLWSVAARSSPLALASERLAFKKVRYHYSHLTGTKGRARSALTVEKFDALAGVNA